MIPITAEKTFSQWTTENPHFYDDRISLGLIDEATISLIEDWFGFRILCDDDKFNVFYGRQLDLILPRYNKLVRLENTEFDALVNTYRERQVTGTGSEGETNTKEKTGSKTDEYEIDESKTRTANLTVTTDETRIRTPNLSSQETKNLTDVSATQGETVTDGTVGVTEHSDARAVNKQNPQSISYVNATAGEIPSLDWRYPSTQTQSDGDSTSQTDDDTTVTRDDTTTTTRTGTDTTLQTGTDTNDIDGTKTTTGTDKVDTTGTDTRNISTSDTEEGEKTKTTSDLIREIWTGRDNLTPQEALKAAMMYVRTSSAFAWLKDQLEVCFLSVYDV
jgi:hypothetical protein